MRCKYLSGTYPTFRFNKNNVAKSETEPVVESEPKPEANVSLMEIAKIS